MNPEYLTPKILSLPKALATTFARSGTDAYEELVAVGNLVLIEASRSYKGPTSGFGNYAYTSVKRGMRKSLGLGSGYGQAKRWAKLSALDDQTADSVVSEQQTVTLDDREVIEKLLRKLPPIQRAVYVLLNGQSLPRKEVATRLGITVHHVSDLHTQAKKRLSDCRAKLYRRHANNLPKKDPPRTIRQRRAATKFCHDRARANRAMGRIAAADSKVFYLVDDHERTLLGPAETLRQIMNFLGLPKCRDRGRHGLPKDSATVTAAFPSKRIVRGSEGKILYDQGYRLVYRSRRTGWPCSNHASTA